MNSVAAQGGLGGPETDGGRGGGVSEEVVQRFESGGLELCEVEGEGFGADLVELLER